MDIGRIHEAVMVLTELTAAIEKLPADERETAGLRMAFGRVRDNLERLAQHYAQLCSFPDALWVTAMEGGSPSPEASAETAQLLKWLADNEKE
jgi:hypothetical protein